MQLQYKGKKHSKNVNHLIIKIVTDGLLYQEIKNLKPLFKKEKIIKSCWMSEICRPGANFKNNFTSVICTTCSIFNLNKKG